jgi:hypothetical protein
LLPSPVNTSMFGIRMPYTLPIFKRHLVFLNISLV